MHPLNPNRYPRTSLFLRVIARMTLGTTLALGVLLAGNETAWAKKGKEKEVVVETKGYVFPYLIVIAVMSVGMMTVLRPGSRLDNPPQKVKDDD